MDQLQQLFSYDIWANRHTAAALKYPLGTPLSQCVNLFAHIGASQEIWYRRIIAKDTSTIELWPNGPSVDTTLKSLETLHEKWVGLLHAADSETVVSYTNSSGATFNTLMPGILNHVIIHGQHHRAQISLLLRQKGIKPPATDFIFYLRET